MRAGRNPSRSLSGCKRASKANHQSLAAKPKASNIKHKTYVRASNGYILKGMENENDVKRGLYMLSIPSDFIFRIQLTEFSHVYKLRRELGTAHPELKQAVESMASQLEVATQGLVTRDLLLEIPN